MGDGEGLLLDEDKNKGQDAAPIPRDDSTDGERQSSTNPPEMVDDWSDSLAGIGALTEKAELERLKGRNEEYAFDHKDLMISDKVIAHRGDNEAALAMKAAHREKITSLFPNASPELLDKMFQAADAKLEADGKARLAQAEEDHKQKQQDADAKAQAFILSLDSDRPLEEILENLSKSTESSEPTEPTEQSEAA